MGTSATMRKLLTATLALAIMLWAEAGLALIVGGQGMQCSMTAHQMAEMSMPGCPDEQVQAPTASHPECCSNNDGAERPLGFVVTSERTKVHPLDAVAEVPADLAPQTAQHFGVWRSADAPRFVKPILELKTDLRI